MKEDNVEQILEALREDIRKGRWIIDKRYTGRPFEVEIMMKFLDDIIRDDPLLVEAYRRRGTLLLGEEQNEKEREEAFYFYRQAHDVALHNIKKNPQSAFAYRQLGDVFFWLEDVAEATKAYDRAIELDPTDLYAYAHKGFLYFVYLPEREHESFSTYPGLLALDQAICLRPNNIDLLYFKGNLLFEFGFAEEADPIYDRIIELEPMKPSSYYGKLQVLYKRRDEEGIRKMQQHLAALKT